MASQLKTGTLASASLATAESFRAMRAGDRAVEFVVPKPLSSPEALLVSQLLGALHAFPAADGRVSCAGGFEKTGVASALS